MQTYRKACLHGEFLLLRGDYISAFMDAYGDWAEVEVRLFDLLLEHGGHVVEVGANIGTHSVPLARLASRSPCVEGQLICYEPQRVISQVLAANVIQNHLTNVVIRPVAVGADRQTIEIEAVSYDEKWNYGAFSITQGYSKELAFQGRVSHESIELIRLDDEVAIAALDHIGLLKIDAEGAEVDVIKGAQMTIARTRPPIFVEANNAAVFDGVMDHLRLLDYSCYWFVGARYNPLNIHQAAVMEHLVGADINLICLPQERVFNYPALINLLGEPAQSFDQCRALLEKPYICTTSL